MTLLDTYRYQGRHRLDTGPTAGGRAAVVAALTVGGLAAGVSPALAVDWDPIITCESGGRNIHTQIPGPYTASGYLQITNGTWARFGGKAYAPTAMQATRAQQIAVAERIAAANPSLSDWASSKSCWGSKIGSTRPAPQAAPRAVVKAAPKAAPKPRPVVARAVTKAATPKPAPARTAAPRPARAATGGVSVGLPKGYRVRDGDTLSELAQTYHVRGGYQAMARTNGLDDPDVILIGQRLR